MFLRTKQYECVIDMSYWFKFLTAFIEPDGNTKMHCVNQALTESPLLHCPPFPNFVFKNRIFLLKFQVMILPKSYLSKLLLADNIYLY